METQSRDAPLVFDDGIKVHIIFVARENFAKRAHTDESALVLADFFLEGSAEAVRVCAARKHGAAAATFKSITADKFGMLFGQVAEAGEIEASRASIIKRGRLADHILGAACDAGTHNVFAKIVA